MTRPDSGQLEARIVGVDRLSPVQTRGMYQLMRSHYDGTVESDFLRDLTKKTDVILLEDTGSGHLKGFSTLIVQRLKLGRRHCYGLFSGDTIVEPEYWGQRALQRKFAQYIFRFKIRHPLSPVFWFLISKGYKTYLLLANNFFVHYPRFEKRTPKDIKETMDAFYATMFPNQYDANTGLIHFGADACRLKSGVAEITPELIQTNQRINYFSSRNPHWREGVELACVGEINLYTPFLYVLKTYLRTPCRAAIEVIRSKMSRSTSLSSQRSS